MAKRKPLALTEVHDLIGKAEEATHATLIIKEAISNVAIEDINNPLELAGCLIAASRDLNNVALALLSRHDLQETKKKLESYQEKP